MLIIAFEAVSDYANKLCSVQVLIINKSKGYQPEKHTSVLLNCTIFLGLCFQCPIKCYYCL